MDPQNVTNSDWPIHNQIALKSLLHSAYADTISNCDPKRSPIYSTPNQHFHSGHTRWISVNYWLKRGCDSGLLQGITPVWRPAVEKQEKGCWILELQGRFTSLVACHVSDVEESPRESRTRRDYRAGNQQ